MPTDLARRVASFYGDWEQLFSADISLLTTQFSEAELASIDRAKTRREIPRDTVARLIAECELRCCLCWSIDSDSGVVIHHIRPHASAPDDRYENLVVLCTNHHSQVHTRWELARHPYPPELLLRRKADFVAAIAAFRAGTRSAPGREGNMDAYILAPPLPPLHFVGREALVQGIADAAITGGRRAAIVGMGGVGKTALALRIAASHAVRFPGGILWVESGPEPAGVQRILVQLTRKLGHDVTGLATNEHLALLSSLLSARATIGSTLLVLDDVAEVNVTGMVSLVASLPPSVSLLITTREATVGTALGAIQFLLGPLTRTDSRVLLESVSGSSLVTSEKEGADVLLSLVGDLPLAVELVARQIALHEPQPGFSIETLCKRLQGFAPEILSFPGHRGVAMSFALSYQNLDGDAQRIFRSTGLFAHGPLHKADISIVAGIPEDEMSVLLDRLVVVSMLNWGEKPSEYRIHPLMQKYAEFLFDRAVADERHVTRERFCQHYTSAAVEAAAHTPQSLVAMDTLFDNVAKAIRIASERKEYGVVLQSVLSLSAKMEYFTLRNRDQEAMPLLHLAIAAARHLCDKDAEGVAVGHLATACARLGLIRDAVRHSQRAVALATQSGNDYDLASHLQNLGAALLAEAKDLPRAERCLHEGLEAAERSKNTDAVIGCLSCLANLHRDLGRFAEAAKLYSAALQCARLVGDRLSEGNNLSNLGLVTMELGHTDEAERMITDALDIAVNIGDRRGEGNRTGHIGGLLIGRAKLLPPGPESRAMLAHAEERTSAALRIAQQTGDTEKAGCWLMNLGGIAVLRGDDPGAMKFFQQALQISEAGGFARLEAQIRFNVGSTLASQRQLRPAIEQFRVAGDLLRRMRSPMAHMAEEYIRRATEMLNEG